MGATRSGDDPPIDYARLQHVYGDFAGLAEAAHETIRPVLDSLSRRLVPKLGYRVLTITRERGKSFERAFSKVKPLFIENPETDPAEAFGTIDDLAGARILTQYPSHSYDADAELCAFAGENPASLQVDEELDDKIVKPGDYGFRGLQRKCRIYLDDFEVWFRIEMQYLTFHQYHWAEMQHVMYESHGDFPPAIHEELHLLSERLHELNVRADALRWAIEFHRLKRDE